MQCSIKGDTPYSTAIQLYLTAIAEGPEIRMAAKAVDPEHKSSEDMTKCSLPHLRSYVAKTLFGQGLLQTS